MGGELITRETLWHCIVLWRGLPQKGVHVRLLLLQPRCEASGQLPPHFVAEVMRHGPQTTLLFLRRDSTFSSQRRGPPVGAPRSLRGAVSAPFTSAATFPCVPHAFLRAVPPIVPSPPPSPTALGLQTHSRASRGSGCCRAWATSLSRRRSLWGWHALTCLHAKVKCSLCPVHFLAS